jgi:hypothetical protein
MVWNFLAPCLSSHNEFATHDQLLPDVVDCTLEHDALRACLAFQTGHECAEMVEAGPDGLATFLF